MDANSPISQLDVAPTIAQVLEIRLPKTDGRIIDGIAGWGCRDVVLIIIDSLGYDLFRWLEPRLDNMSSLATHGRIYSARAVSRHTTPAIATILSGLLPEHHGILDKAGAKEFLRKFINIGPVSFFSNAYGHNEYDNFMLFNFINDSVALPDSPKAAKTDEFTNKRFALFFRIVG